MNREAFQKRVLLIAASLAFGAPALSAQSAWQCPCGSLGLVAGVAYSDFSADGRASYLAVRGDHSLGSRYFAGEVSLGRFTGDENFGGRRTYFIADVQPQLMLPLGPIAPYIGAGLGWLRTTGGDPRGTRSEVTASIAAGLRVALPSMPVALRLEGRARLIGTYYTSGGSELTAGLAWRF